MYFLFFILFLEGNVVFKQKNLARVSEEGHLYDWNLISYLFSRAKRKVPQQQSFNRNSLVPKQSDWRPSQFQQNSRFLKMESDQRPNKYSQKGQDLKTGPKFKGGNLPPKDRVRNQQARLTLGPSTCSLPSLAAVGGPTSGHQILLTWEIKLPLISPAVVGFSSRIAENCNSGQAS